LINANVGNEKASDLMAKKTAPPSKNPLIWKFIATYIILMGLSLLLLGLESVKEILDINGIYTRMIIYLSALILKPFGIVQSISGSVINLKGIALNVLFGCNGLEAFLIYSVAILSFPATKQKKLIGITAGFVIIQIINVLRIAGLGLIGFYFKQYFHYFHIYIAQGMMIAVALVLFLFWLNYAQQE